MGSLACPNCGAAIDAADVNVAKDVMFCRSCSRAHSLSGTVAVHAVASTRPMVDIHHPPAGAWFRDEGDTFRVGATTRSFMAFFLVPFMLIWSGGSLGGIYGSQIINGQFNLLLSLFGIPFLLGSIFFWGVALLSIWGRVEVSIRGDEGLVFTGIGAFGRRKAFRCSDIAVVREDVQTGQKSVYRVIVLEGATRISFGSMLNDTRRHFIVEVLRTLLVPKAR